MPSLSDIARTAVSEAARNCQTMEELRDLRDSDEMDDAIESCLDSYTTYYHECLDLIPQLESDWSFDMPDEGEFAPSEWRDCMATYARGLLHAGLNGTVSEYLDELEEAIEEFIEVVEGFQEEECLPDPVDALVSSDCLYGWAAHNYETPEGVHVWSDERHGMFPQKLEGELYAVSHRVGEGIWLNIAWDPTKINGEEAA